MSSYYYYHTRLAPPAGSRAPDFLKLLLCGWPYVCVCVCACVRACLPPRLLITSGVIWTPYDYLNKFYSFYMAAIVDIVDARSRNQPNKSKLVLCKL